MNPLFLLLGLFGTTGSLLFGRKSSANERAPDKLNDLAGNRSKKDDMEETDEPREPTDTVPEPVTETDETEAGQIEPDTTPPVTTTPDTVPTDPTPTTPPVTDTMDPTPTDPTPTTPPVTDTTDPTPTDPTPTTPDVSNPAPTAPEQAGGSGEDGGEVAALTAQGTLSVYGGRVSTLDPVGDDVTSVRITSDVDHGSLTVNSDNTLALVMTRSDFVGSQSFSYEVTHTDGSTSSHSVGLNVEQGLQAYGWGTSEQQYMLATDADDKVIVEHGENHIKVHVSGSSDALTRADIAAMEGVSESQVTGSWLASNTTYGQSEDTALAADLGMEMWYSVTPRDSESSNWLLFERGYDYAPGEFMVRGADGEGELQPLYIGAFGTGDQPEITNNINSLAEANTNVVIQDIHFSDGVNLLGSSNILFDNVEFTGSENVVQWADGITFRNSSFLDIVREQSADGGDWETHADRYQGLFAHDVEGLLLDGLFLDHVAWSEDYQYDGSADGGQPPSMFSHNLYLTQDNQDLTLRDSIIMRAASTGAQIRSGGYIEDNVFIDNNIGLNFVGGQDDGTALYTLFADNVVTGGGFHDAEMIGALAYGVDSRGALSALVDNIVAHAADPNNAEELADRLQAFISYKPDEGHYYDDTIVYNWQGSQQDPNWDNLSEHNTEGLNTGTLNQTTIQLFAAQLLGDPNASVEDLADFLAAQASDGINNDTIDADTIIRYFQEGFGIQAGMRTGATTVRFAPDDLADGVRWDNRLNWDTDDLPGLYANDSVDLGGNEVVFNDTTTINALDLSGGFLDLYGGRLTATGGLVDAGRVELQEAGQLWVEGSDGGDLDIDVLGGRFVNTGDMSGADLTATDGQTILATGGAEYDVSASKTLAVFEAAARVGFDGEDGGIAILDMHEGSTLAFAAQDGDLGSIEEFRSGAFGDSPNVQSGIDLGDSTLSIDLSGLSSAAGTAFTLMDADEIVGMFNDTDIGGLGARDARIVIDYEDDSVTLELSSGNGAVTVDTVGAQTDVTSGEEALWNALTDGQGVVTETAAAMVPDEEDLLDIAA